MNEIGRRHPVHQPVQYRFNTLVIVFLTVCTKNRKSILANEPAHQLLREAWNTADSWNVGRYVVMPDHVHLFCAPAAQLAPSLTQWVNFWKSSVARCWPCVAETPIWQRHFWDTQLRRADSYDAKWSYVAQNPERAGLITPGEDWPYQGEMHVLRW